jgi:hypothetical protein
MKHAEIAERYERARATVEAHHGRVIFAPGGALVGAVICVGVSAARGNPGRALSFIKATKLAIGKITRSSIGSSCGVGRGKQTCPLAAGKQLREKLTNGTPGKRLYRARPARYPDKRGLGALGPFPRALRED